MNDLPIPKWLLPYTTDEAIADSGDPDIILNAWKAYYEANAKHHASQPKPKMSIKDLIVQTRTAPPVVPVVAPTTTKISPKPCPPVSTMAMLEMTIWDNWFGSETRPDVKRINWHRFNMRFNCWTETDLTMENVDRSVEFSCTTSLLDRFAFIKAIDKKCFKEKSITEQYHAQMMNVIDNSTDQCHFGLFTGTGAVVNNGSGNSPIEDQFVRIELDRGFPTYCTLHLNGIETFVANWTNKHNGGNPLLGPCYIEPGTKADFRKSQPIYACRNDFAGTYYSSWQSTQMTV